LALSFLLAGCGKQNERRSAAPVSVAESAVEVRASDDGIVIRTPSAEFTLSRTGALCGVLIKDGTKLTLDDMKRMADAKAAGLLEKLKTNPNDATTLNQLGILYRATHQFKEAEGYFEKSLEIDPKNADVRTDLASCLYYTGDADGALAQLNKALTYDPKHAGALMNIGIIKWKAKNDVPGAVAAWEKLLKLNPDFKQKDAVQRMIADAQQGAKS